MRARHFFAMPVALAAIVVIGGVALATPASGLTSTPIANGTLDPVNIHVKNGDWMTKLQIKGESSVSVVENRGGARRHVRVAQPSRPEPDHREVRDDHLSITVMTRVAPRGRARRRCAHRRRHGRPYRSQRRHRGRGRHRDQVPAARRPDPDRRASLRLLRLLTLPVLRAHLGWVRRLGVSRALDCTPDQPPGDRAF